MDVLTPRAYLDLMEGISKTPKRRTKKAPVARRFNIKPGKPVDPTKLFGLSEEERREVRLAAMHPVMVNKEREMRAEMVKETEEMKRRVIRIMENKKSQREQLHKEQMDHIAYEEENFISKLDDFLKIQGDKDTQARKEMYNVWVQRVFERLDKQLAEKMQKLSSKELSARLNKLFDQYIDAASRKTIYRDVIIESEYDPMEAKAFIPKIDMRYRAMLNPDGLVDPMKEQINKVMEIHNGGADLPQMQPCPGRSVLSLHEWATGQIEATPHGFAAMFFIKSLEEQGLTQEEKAARNRKNMSKGIQNGVMDHYNIVTGAEASNSEFSKGKRVGYDTSHLGLEKKDEQRHKNPIFSRGGPMDER